MRSTTRTTAALYRAAKIGLNLHRSSATYGRNMPRILHAESMNPRAYELAATQSFQISDWRPEVQETFVGAVPTFQSAAELERLIRALSEPFPGTPAPGAPGAAADPAAYLRRARGEDAGRSRIARASDLSKRSLNAHGSEIRGARTA